MVGKTMATEINTLEDLFIHNLKAAYNAETRLEEELEMMAGEVTDDKLVGVLSEHVKETIDQQRRLEEIFDHMGEAAEEHESPAFRGLIEESKHLNDSITEEEMINIAFLSQAKKVERLEISMYESLLMLSRELELDDEIIDRLRENHEQERDALDSLQNVSESPGIEGIIERLLS